MSIESRVSSVLHAKNLNESLTGFSSFQLSNLQFEKQTKFDLPTNVRLGHLAEKIVSQLIQHSSNYDLLYENVQVVEGKKTVGELDFIVRNKASNQVTHVELAYKFYLFDPQISTNSINNWIGPNRNDSLVEKLDKLKQKQFPLLYHENSKSLLNTINFDEIKQALCLLASLYVPYDHQQIFNPDYSKCIRGYYFNATLFAARDHSDKQYFIPSKKEWGIHPVHNKIWLNYADVQNEIQQVEIQQRAILCWEKHKENYSEFFIVWW